ncbi:hypothetical protein QYE76_064725 [Lolium multiflorum]|uniref:FHA domain-containing protein n=1 Tax=Lolium multiflorum TaxID=4521 RepID=A0AAD8S9H9_LOLMU|nr:hypothetical protein QYE76_064725 [Lolium multiflorum]
MATAAAEAADAGTEAPIAAFAVAKGGVVLKHIFLNVPPPEEARRGEDGDGDVDPDEEEEDPPVLFGRHPDCHVLLDHPSISRRHLELRCKRRQRRIAVTDLSSVHGTRVSGQRIPPNTPVELVAGDTLQLGASKREYRLHWLSLSEAFETEDLLPPLVEEDKEELHAHQEAWNQLVPTQTEPLDTETHQEMILQVMSEQTEFCAEVIPSAPPLPESANSSSLKESLLSVLQEKIVSENSGTESVAPSTIQAARTLVQSDKQNASGTMSRRAKLKSVKSLHIDTGRRIRTLSHSCQKEEGQYENLVCSQNCKGECAACMVLFKNSDVKEAEEKEKVIAPEKDHMNPHVLDIITMEGNQEVPTVHMESYEAVPENPFTHAITCGNMTNHPDMKYDDGGLSNKEKLSQNKIAMEDSELQGIIFGSIFDNLDTEGRTEEKEENSLMDKENTTPLVSGNIITERSQLMLKPIISQELMDSISPLNLEHDSFSDSENSMLNIGNKMTANELTSENLETEFILMSDEHFNNDIIPDKENSVLAPGKYDAAISPVKQEDLFPDENMTPASRDLKPIAGNILGSRMDSSVSAEYTSNRSIHQRHCSELSSEYDAAISPAKQEDLFPDENMTPASRDIKPIAGNILGSRMDSSVSAEYTSNRSIHQRHCSELSSEYDATSPVRQRDILPNKENVTLASRGLKSISREVLGSRMDNTLSAEYTPNRSIDQRKCNDLSSKSKRFHTVDDEVFYSDKENLTPISTGDMKARRCLPKNLFQLDADQDQEAFCSDKENSTPASSVVQKTRDMSENRARIESAITKKRVEDRLPFQTLLSNSPLRPTSSFDSTQANAGTADFSIRLEDGLNSFPHLEQHKNRESDRVGEGMKVWTMVADTDCLLDDESMKSIMLLKGIKGTHLIIPRIVIRELDSMKQREGLFKRSTKATSILQWIEDCMANESWWIHVQSSSEMLPVAPTPPATRTETQRSDGEREAAAAAGTFNTMLSLFSPRSFTGIFSPRSLTDIVSPRTEDRVLDCALLFNKLRGSQNMVILSNSVTLKIKAMSEGLLCEGAKEFRETLMNPCSGRFMWATSVPRGAAWSRLDETALAENYYNSHHHREARRNVPAARGLKLILLHNSSSLGAHAGDQLRRRDDAVAGSTASASC